MKINDELLDRLGIYFVSMKIHETYSIPFEEFVQKYQRGTWEL